MVRGNWKKKRYLRQRFVRRALALTTATPKEIGERMGGNKSNVSAINLKEEIRPKELVRALRKSEPHYRKKKYQKISRFSEKEKEKLIEQCMPTIKSFAGTWWKSKLVKDKFQYDWKSFLVEIKAFAGESLDYFDPKRVIQPKTFIIDCVKLFCNRSYFDEKRRREKQPKKELLKRIEQQGTAIYTRSWIPPQARPFLKKLGLDPERVADVGFGDIEKKLLQIAMAKETGLTQIEKNTTELRLRGLTLDEIAKRHGLKAKSSIHNIETKAAAKIKRRLPKTTSK